ncbi:c-type cytochrome [Sulfitobacter mediterraneus]|uniref:c-type cytochrome n=1 Tax=Sulfitobacter mediterraneus TaxID=83219 RepID=UPI0004681EA8|nr:cytochrome c [Sulfitobacter mediterraneus]
MRGLVKILGACAVIGAGLGWFLTAPDPLDPAFGARLTADPEAGALVFAAGGCVSCHAAPGAEGDDKQVLAGGLAFASDFGTFYAPNISPDPNAGIGAWSLPGFARAVTRGVSPEGQHYYPAFPYAAYQHMQDQDVVNLFAYMQTLPADPTPSKAHDVGFPFNIRRSLGGWKLLFMKDEFVLSGNHSTEMTRGRYLAEGLAHCGECHTPRNALGGLDRSQWLAGAPNPSGKGRIPNITPGKLDWSESDLVAYFATGFTPDYDSAGGEMAEVVSNLAQLPQSDREAIAAYLKAVPAIP